MTKEKKAHGSEGGNKTQPKIYNTVSFIQIKNKCAHTKTGILKDIKKRDIKHSDITASGKVGEIEWRMRTSGEQTGTNGRHKMTTRTALTSPWKLVPWVHH